MLPRAIPGDTPTPWKRVSADSSVIAGRLARMSTKEHRLSSPCAKQAFPPVLTANRSGLKAALGAQARMPGSAIAVIPPMKVNGCRDFSIPSRIGVSLGVHHAASIFIEASVDKLFDFFERALGIGSFTTNLQFRSLSRRQHHQAHDALAIYLFTLLFHPHLGPKPTRNLDE